MAYAKPVGPIGGYEYAKPVYTEEEKKRLEEEAKFKRTHFAKPVDTSYWGGVKERAGKLVDQAEAGASLVTSLLSWIPAGLYAAGAYGDKIMGHPSGLMAEKSPHEIKENVDSIISALTYKPKRPAAQEATATMGSPFQWLEERAPETGDYWAGQAEKIPVVGKHIAPAVGTTGHTVTEGLPFLLPMLLKGIVPKVRARARTRRIERAKKFEKEMAAQGERVERAVELPFEKPKEGERIPTPIEAAEYQKMREAIRTDQQNVAAQGELQDYGTTLPFEKPIGGERIPTPLEAVEYKKMRAKPVEGPRVIGEPITTEFTSELYAGAKSTPKRQGPVAPQTIPEKKPITFEKGIMGEAGELKLPKFREISQGARGTAQRMYDYLDVQAPFNRAGTAETGIWMKNYPSIGIKEQNYALDVSKKLGKLKIGREEGVRVTIEATREPGVLETVGLKKDKVSQGASKVREYFEESFKRHKEAGTLEHRWPQTQHARNIERIKTLEEFAAATDQSEAKQWYLREAEHLRETNQLIEKINPRYVHAPVGIWFDILESELGRIGAAKVLRSTVTRFFRQRELVDLPGLIEYLRELKNPEGKLIFKPDHFDIRFIMASYAKKSGKILGLAKIMNAAKKDGLVIKGGRQPDGYGPAPAEMRAQIPDLKGAWVHNMFLDYIQNFVSQLGPEGVKLGRIMGYTKILAFYNPLFLPIYDLYQGVWLGSTRSLKMPIWLWKGVKSVWTRDKAFYEAQGNGALSTPYAPPFENFVRDMMASADYQIVKKFYKMAKRWPAGFPIIDDFMRGVWHLAWKGDQMVRMAGYHYLIKKGVKPLEAAQEVAHFHGDYARLRPNVRRWVNKVLFTPTFKYAMTHVQATMAKSAAKVARDLMRGKKPLAKDIRYAQGLLGLVGTILARDLFMTKFLGFKRDTFGLRYTREVDTEQGKKEVVVYQATPGNTILRQVLKWTNWGDDPDHMEEFFNKAKWDLHPLWRLGIELWHNQKSDGKIVYNPFDDPREIARDQLIHSFKTIVAIVGAIERRFDEGEGLSAYEELRKDLGYIWGSFLEASSLAYLRGIPESRVPWKANKLGDIYREYFRKDPPKMPEEAEKRVKNFLKKLNDILEEMEK